MSEHDSWKNLIVECMSQYGETWDDWEHHTMTDEELNQTFYTGYGGSDGCPFTLWTSNRVYFPVCYDGAEWVDSVPRFPCEEKTNHIGGG